VNKERSAMESTTQGKGWTLLVGVSYRGECLTMVLTAEEIEAVRSGDEDAIRAILNEAPPERIIFRQMNWPGASW
jgi:hypothetical protein